ncbi:MAG: hypothetical protein RQ735_12055 [Flavobacteriaceae bacterium]|nr:hypothetical protein [Flavobacteriaceae bacterium]
MKRTGIIILAIGLLITIFTGFNFVTKKKVVDIGELQITQNKNHSIGWSPIIGVAVLVAGLGIYLYGSEKSRG